MNPGKRTQIALLGVLLGTVGTLSACSGSTTSSASPSMTEATTAAPTTAAPTSSPGGGPCNGEVIAAALPSGSKVLAFDCANVSGTEWAAVKVNPGPTVFFLQWNDGNWDVSTADEVCGTASAGLPAKLLDYCEGSAGDAGSPEASESMDSAEMSEGMDSSVSPS